MDIFPDGLSTLLGYLWIIALAGVVFLGIIAIVLGWIKKKALGVVIGFFVCLIYFTFYPFVGKIPVRKYRSWTKEEIKEAAEKSVKELDRLGIKEKPDKSVGMTVDELKQMFWDLVKLQDSYMRKYPYDNQKQQEAYKIIARQYGVYEHVVRQVAVRGIKEEWPKPSLK